MTTLTCAEVEGQLDLLAAGECDRHVQQQIERHLAHCPACTARHAQSQHLIGLLDLEVDRLRLGRLRQRIEQEQRRQQRSRVLPFVGRFASAAALLLMTLAVSAPWPVREPGADAPAIQLATQAVVPGEAIKMVPVRAGPGGRERTNVVEAHLPADQVRGAAARQKLLELQREGRLPPPTAAPLELRLKNTGNRPLEFRLGDGAARLELDVHGKGVVRLPAPGAAEPDVLRPHAFWLAAGAERVFRLERLIAGRPGQVEYLYLVEPGAYTVTVRWRLTLGGRVTALTGKPASVEVVP
jgi:hypothetical protein